MILNNNLLLYLACDKKWTCSTVLRFLEISTSLQQPVDDVHMSLLNTNILWNIHLNIKGHLSLLICEDVLKILLIKDDIKPFCILYVYHHISLNIWCNLSLLISLSFSDHFPHTHSYVSSSPLPSNLQYTVVTQHTFSKVGY